MMAPSNFHDRMPFEVRHSRYTTSPIVSRCQEEPIRRSSGISERAVREPRWTGGGSPSIARSENELVAGLDLQMNDTDSD